MMRQVVTQKIAFHLLYFLGEVMNDDFPLFINV